tara:strand:- start:1129 stop:2052 length:924 start_codon:yes stop_codon:yes gene_type:complete
MRLIKPLFWKKRNFISFLLYPFTILTLLVNLLKKFSKKKKFNIKTICVGNIFIGGTGKTPLSIKINEILKKKYKTVFIKKKYSNQLDEQKILMNNGKLICKNYRSVAIKIAEKQKYNVAIIDDGLQEKDINYDIKIVCFNSSELEGNGFLIPSGPLRENISELKNYDVVFLNGEKKNKKFKLKIKKINNNLKIFEGKYIPTNLKKFNRNKNFLIFAGLGSPEEFERTLKKYKFKIKEKFIFPDHHKFLDSEIIEIKKIAKNKKLSILTTEKDYLRLNNKYTKNIKFLKIELEINNKEKFSKFLMENL